MQQRIKNNLRIVEGKALLWSDEYGLSWLEFVSGVEISGRDAYDIFELSKVTATDDEYFRVVIDLRSNPVITKEARDFAASGATAGHISAFAILANDLSMRLVGNFFIHFHKPNQPTRIFTDEDEARRWLLEQREKK